MSIQFAKQSFALNYSTKYTSKELFDRVLKGIASNVKMGPFTATSGVILPYYLNASTNFLDKNIAPHIVTIFADYLENVIKPDIPTTVFEKHKSILCVGMEVAGGMLVCQLASAANPKLNSWLDFCYVRKHKKTTGTCQQLEGPQIFTSRTAKSPELPAIWIDDSLSTGQSMLDGMKMLKKEYNINVIAALYLVDRSADRQNLKEEKQYLADPLFQQVNLKAIYDLKQVDEIISNKQG